MRSVLRSQALSGLLAAALAASCDPLGVERFAVVAWTPGQGRAEAPFRLSLSLSGEADRASVESAFSLSENGARVTGAFDWNGDTFDFLAEAPWAPYADYRLTLSGEARSLTGVSLAEPFEARFSTRPEDGRPRVLWCKPGDGGTLASRYEPLSLAFSEPVALASLRSCLVLAPAVKGSWTPTSGLDGATFAPLEPWEPGVDYELRVSAELSDSWGNAAGQDWKARFSFGAQPSAPRLLGAEAVSEDGTRGIILAPDDAEDGELTLNRGWEAAWGLRLSFSEPVLRRSLEARLACDGGSRLIVQGGSELADSYELRFERRPEWDSSLVLRLESGLEGAAGGSSEAASVYRIVADGPRSRPPRFIGLRLPLYPGRAIPDDRELTAFPSDQPFLTLALDSSPEAYPIGVDVPVSLELYLELAEGAALDVVSLMRAFRWRATNDAVTLAVDRLTLGGVDGAEPHAPWDGFAVARLEARVRNRVGLGVVTLELAAGLADSRGNASSEAQAVVLLK